MYTPGLLVRRSAPSDSPRQVARTVSALEPYKLASLSPEARESLVEALSWRALTPAFLPGGPAAPEVLCAAAIDALGRSHFAACCELVAACDALSGRRTAAASFALRSLVLWSPESAASHAGPSEHYVAFKNAPQAERDRAALLYRALGDDERASAGACLMSGVFANLVEGDKARAVRLWLRASALGSAGADCCLGLFHEFGEGGLPADGRRALEMYEHAATAGHANARCHVGLCLLQGLGMDGPRLADAARAGTRLLGDCHAHGLGVPRDEAEAERLYKIAAGLGDTRAMVVVAVHEERRGHAAEAVRWLRESHRLGDVMAATRLGIALAQGTLGLPQDAREAVAILKSAQTREALLTALTMHAR
eukprot:m51a1_g5688 hypothetical protein (366) ;mRNA; f:989785-991017